MADKGRGRSENFTMYLLCYLIFKPRECYLFKTVKAIRRKKVFQPPQPCVQAALGEQKNRSRTLE